MAGGKQITLAQQVVLDSLLCERFSRSSANVALLESFENPQGEMLIDYAKERGFEEDSRGDTAFYIVKTKDGRGLFFFSLKCGELFSPLAHNELQDNCLTLTQALLNASSPDVDRKHVLKKLKALSQTKGMTLEETVNFIFQNANRKKQILDLLKRDLDIEKNSKVLRVAKTFSGVQLVHFCSNKGASDLWNGFEMNRPMGETLFWHFIAPIFLEVRKHVGCEYAFLFAADLSEDRQLINYYNQSLKFTQEREIGANKPIYDFSCAFMCQPLNRLETNRRLFFDHFNDERAI